MKTKIDYLPEATNNEILKFRQIAGLYLRNITDRDTKLYYAVEKVFKKLEAACEDFLEEQRSIQRNNAMVDSSTKRLLREPGLDQYQYDAIGAAAVQDGIRNLRRKKVQFKPYFVAYEDLPSDLTFNYKTENGAIFEMAHFDVKAAFENFVIKPIEDTD